MTSADEVTSRLTEEIVPKDAFSPAHIPTAIHWWFVLFARPDVYIFFSYLFSQKAILFSTGMVMMVMMAVVVVMVVVEVVFRYHKNKVENGTTGNFIEFSPSPSLSDNRCNRFKTKNFYYVLTQYKKSDKIINQIYAQTYAHYLKFMHLNDKIPSASDVLLVHTDE